MLPKDRTQVPRKNLEGDNYFSLVLQGGLEEILVAAGGEKMKEGTGWSWIQNGESGKKKSGGHTGLWTVLIILMFIATGAFVAAVKIHRDRQNPSQYVDLNSMGYTPPIL